MIRIRMIRIRIDDTGLAFFYQNQVAMEWMAVDAESGRLHGGISSSSLSQAFPEVNTDPYTDPYTDPWRDLLQLPLSGFPGRIESIQP